MATTKEMTQVAQPVPAGRVPPQAVEAEVAVLGAMLLDSAAIGAADNIRLSVAIRGRALFINSFVAVHISCSPRRG